MTEDTYTLNIAVSEEVRNAILDCIAELENRLSTDLLQTAKYGEHDRDNQIKETAEKLKKWHIAEENIGRYHLYKRVNDSDE